MPNKKTVIVGSAILAVSVVLFVWVGFQMWQLNKLSTLASEAELTMEITQQLAEKNEQESSPDEQEEQPQEQIILETSAPESTQQPAPTDETITFR